jgi:predicted nucleic acid-binding protein
MSYLLDTCVLSALAAKQPVPEVVAWLADLDPDKAYLSVLTIGEIQKGIEKLPDSQRKSLLRAWLKDDLLIRFRERLLPVDVGVMLTWGTLVSRMEANGTPLPAIDSMMAATALHHGLVVATRNEEDFAPTGVNLFNPWV